MTGPSQVERGGLGLRLVVGRALGLGRPVVHGVPRVSEVLNTTEGVLAVPEGPPVHYGRRTYPVLLKGTPETKAQSPQSR